MYLFRVSTKRKRAYTGPKAKPLYFVTQTKDKALEWAQERVHNDLEITKITKLGRQLGTYVYVGE